MDSLRAWADTLAQIREFFAERGQLEVQTPLAREYAVTDPYQRCFRVVDPDDLTAVPISFLQPSPEAAMKLLLAAGSGSIFQICKAFRCGESGTIHATEFTLLEWYRVGYDHFQLMAEVAELVNRLLPPRPVKQITWRQAFIQYAGVDPAIASQDQLIARLPASMEIDDGGVADNADLRRELLDRLLVSRVEPNLGQNQLTFLYDYPADQAALARIRDDAWPVAQRFELYIDGLEIANGFFELNDSAEQRLRFEADNRQRRREGLTEVPLDEPLLGCLDRLPDCSGVALGVDRLIKIKLGAKTLEEI